MNWRTFWEKTAQAAAGTVVGGIALGILSTIFPNDWPGWLKWLQAIGECFAWLLGLLAFSIPLPLWLALAIVGVSVWFLRQHLRQKNEKHATAISAAEVRFAELQGKLDGAQEQIQALVGEAKAAAPEPKIPADFKPTENQRRALIFLLEKYNTAKQLEELHHYTRCATPAETAIELERLIDAGVLIRRGSVWEFYGLTIVGRDASIRWCKGMRSVFRD